MEHYVCSYCQVSLTGQRYVLRQDEPICITCFEDKFAPRCYECNQPIGSDFKDLSHDGRHWHADCFKCFGCLGSLADKQFVSREGALYCPDCYETNFAQRCDKCNNIFKHGQQKFDYNKKKYHGGCFTCTICQKPIGNSNFVPREEDALICMPCYNDNFAKRCAKCNDVLLHGGVTFRDETFHKECFTCAKCNSDLAHTKFTTRDDKPYCPDCYSTTFTKICSKCDKSIGVIGSATKYVAFDGKQWHADCFLCVACTKNLLGLGFICIQDSIYCPECAKSV